MELIQRIAGLNELPAAVASLLVLAVALLLGLLGYVILFKVLLRFAARSDTSLHQALVLRWRHPAKLLLPLVAALLILPSLQFPVELSSLLQHLSSLALVGTVAWLLAATVLGFQELVLKRYDITASDNLKARAVSTQVSVLVKIVLVLILIIAGATMLMTFDRVRQVGVSLLASAGIAGIIIGFAAQRSLATFIAGIQIAITQPIRLDDVVVVEGEWGRIEEITLTYVVVCIWDLRRLVLPITYFLEKPFQNWTRVSADLLSTVVTTVCRWRLFAQNLSVSLRAQISGMAKPPVSLSWKLRTKPSSCGHWSARKTRGRGGICAAMFVRSWLSFCNASIPIVFHGYGRRWTYPRTNLCRIQNTAQLMMKEKPQSREIMKSARQPPWSSGNGSIGLWRAGGSGGTLQGRD